MQPLRKPRMRYTPHHQREANPKPERPKRDWHDNATLWVAVLGVVVIAISTGISAWLGFLVRDQLIAMRDQQRVMESQQRPWIVVSRVEPTSVFTGVQFDQDKISVFPSITVTNVGQAVAIGTFAQFKLLVDRPKHSTESFREVELSQDALCEGAETQELSSARRLFGDVVAPGQSVEFSSGATANFDGTDFLHSGEKDYLLLILTGCVVYQFYLSPEIHQTRFTYEVRADGIGIPIGEPVSSSRIEFERATFGNSYAN